MVKYQELQGHIDNNCVFYEMLRDFRIPSDSKTFGILIEKSKVKLFSPFNVLASVMDHDESGNVHQFIRDFSEELRVFILLEAHAETAVQTTLIIYITHFHQF